MAPTAATQDTGLSFDEVVVPHLDAAFQLARWMLRNQNDAEDVVQEAALRAFRYFHTFGGGNGRAWFLQIVRHLCWTWRARGGRVHTDPFDEEQHSTAQSAPNPEARLIRLETTTSINRAMSEVPPRWRELLVLRGRDELSYRELADVVGVPMGTVMSGLSRGRQAFRAALGDESTKRRRRNQRRFSTRAGRAHEHGKVPRQGAGDPCAF